MSPIGPRVKARKLDEWQRIVHANPPEKGEDLGTYLQRLDQVAEERPIDERVRVARDRVVGEDDGE